MKKTRFTDEQTVAILRVRDDEGKLRPENAGACVWPALRRGDIRPRV